jgi:hypothetical protein
MTAFDKHLTKQMRPVDLIDRPLSQQGSQGSILLGPHGVASIPQGPPSVRSRVIVPSSSKWQRLGVVLT